MSGGRLAATVAGLAVLVAIATVAIVAWRDAGSDADVSVYPNHRTLAASPETAITFRGAAADQLEDVEVSGSRSGRHTGRWESHPDGDGAAFVPDHGFAPG